MVAQLVERRGYLKAEILKELEIVEKFEDAVHCIKLWTNCFQK
jgi:hypothetical protein